MARMHDSNRAASRRRSRRDRRGRRRRAGQQVYRYVDKDGQVVYSDRAPPSDSKDVQAKRLSRQFHREQRRPARRSRRRRSAFR